MGEKKKPDVSVLCGIGAILTWALVPPVKRLLAENLSMLVSGFFVSTIAGLLLFFKQRREEGFRPVRFVNPRYWVLCALPHIIYILCNCLCTGLASTRESTVFVNLLTSMWALSVLIFTVVITKHRVSRWFPYTCLLSVAGLIIATVTPGSDLGTVLKKDGICLVFAFFSSLFYGFYSGWYCLLVRTARDDFLPLIMITEGLIMGCAALIRGDRISSFGPKVIIGLLFQILLTEAGATLLWTKAMRGKGRMTSVLLSNLSPVLSTTANCLVLGVPIRWQFLVGAFVIVLATVLSKRCLREESPAE